MLRRWSRRASRDVALTTAAGLLSALLFVVLAWSLSHGVSLAMGQDGDDNWMLIGLLALGLRGLVAWGADVFASRAGMAMVAAARADVTAAASSAGASLLLADSPGSRVSQIVDRTALLAGWASRWAPGSRLAAIAPVITLLAIGAQSWVAAALLVAAVLIMPLFLWLTVAETRAAAAAQQASLDVLQGAFQVRTEHAGLIRAFRAIGRETEAIRVAAEGLKQGTMRILRRAFLSSAVLEFFSALSIALLAVYIGFKLLGLFPFETGEIVTLQEGMLVLVLAPDFFAPIRRMSTLHHDRADAVAAAESLAAWLEAAQARPQRLPSLTAAPGTRFDAVSVAQGDALAVDRISFEAAPASITALSGPSGSGKTSILLSLLGLARTTGGRITVDGRPLSPDESLASSVAYVRQAPWLFEGALSDNLRVGCPGASDGDLIAVLEKVGAAGLASPQHGGLSRRIERGGQGLSGGERQRIALARALLRDAPVWLLDEPTAHLDEVSEADLLALLQAESVRRTILVATHEAAVREIADQVVILPAREGVGA